jgi:hypothetical protein
VILVHAQDIVKAMPADVKPRTLRPLRANLSAIMKWPRWLGALGGQHPESPARG